VPAITPIDGAALNWSTIDVAVFDTLFKCGLDPKNHCLLGALN